MGSSNDGPSSEEKEMARLQKEQLEKERADAERKKAEAAALRKAQQASGLASVGAADAAEGAYSASLLGV